MEKAVLKKELADTISRNFNLVFNQVAMYNVSHKSGASAIDRFFESLSDGLDVVSPLAISMNQDQFFMEEEPFESNINTSRVTAHFKKVGIESISFEKHVSREDLTLFLEVITDLNTYATIEVMKQALESKSLTSIKMNHVVFRKITADEEVVKRDSLDGESASSGEQDAGKDSILGGILDIMVANIVSEEIGFRSCFNIIC